MGRRGRLNVASASRRRTVLQIEPVSRTKENQGIQPSTRKREINPTSISGIGLLGEYAEDSDDEEQKDDSSGEENANEENQAKPKDEVDSKLNDFFKEIEAISSEDPNATATNETKDSTTAIDEASVDENVADYVLPAPWQQVCDPSTNFIYYWNTLTNEVSWELPQVPVAPPPAVEQVIAQQDVLGSGYSSPARLTEDQPQLTDEKIEPDGAGGTDSKVTLPLKCLTDEPESSPTPAQRPEILPHTSEPEAREVACLSPDTLVEAILDEQLAMDETVTKSSESRGSPKPKSVSRKKDQPSAIDMFESEDHEDDLGGSENDKQHSSSILEHWTEEKIKNAVPEQMPEYSLKPKNLDGSPHSSPEYAEDNGDEVSPDVVQKDSKDTETCQHTERCDKEEDNGDECEVPAKRAKYEAESDHESVEDFAEKLLEEFLESKPAEPSVGEDMDVESEDEQEEEEENEKEETPLLPPEAFKHNKADRLKDDGGNSPAEIPRSRVGVDRKMEEDNEKLTTEIHDLCQLLSNKLEFLNINKDGLNKLIVVLIQMETRIRDWREGSLSSAYIVKKLREAAEELKRYEQSAVPEGWSCHWDSTYKRYFYTNHATGESKWEFPETSTSADAKDAKKMIPVASNVTATGPWESSIVHETASVNPNLVTPSLESSQLYPSNVVTPAVYSLLTPAVGSTTVQEISSLGYTGQRDYSPAEPANIISSTDVTKDPYRFDDDSPVSEKDKEESGLTPPPPGSSPPPPPPADLQTIPPPPPPQDDVVDMVIPAPPPPCNSSLNETEQVNTAADKVAQIQRPLVDYSDPEGGGIYQSSAKVHSSDNARSSPVPMATNTKRKKKKSKLSSVPIRTSKVKQMSSLVQKWQSIKKQEEVVSEEESDDEDRAAKAEAQIEQWRQEQIASGQAAANPNFQEITGDWRERVRKAKLRTAKSEQT